MHLKSCCFSLLGSNSHTAGVGECCYTAISRNVVGKNLHATIPNVNMDYDQYTVPDTEAVEPTFVAFFYHSQTYVHGLSCHSFKLLWKKVNSKPPTIPFGIAVCTFSDNLSRNTVAVNLENYCFISCQTRFVHCFIFFLKNVREFFCSPFSY